MSSKPTLKRDRRVSFSDMEHIQNIERVTEADDAGAENDTKNALWYSCQDLKVLRESQEKDSEACSAFFEPFGKQRQREFIAEILRQQNEHRLMGMVDPKGLFQVSKTFSKKSTQDARKSAKAHEQEVREYWEARNAFTMGILDEALDLLSSEDGL